MKSHRFLAQDIKKLVNSMVVMIDSREKSNSHIIQYFEKHGINYVVSKLEYGDYSFMIPESVAGKDIYFHRDIVIERKASLEELSGNLAQERDRFEKEFLKAGSDGCKTYLMIEEPRGYSSIIAHEYKTKFKPVAYMASLKTWEHRFGTNVQFIDKEYSGYYIYSTFMYFAREVLK